MLAYTAKMDPAAQERLGIVSPSINIMLLKRKTGISKFALCKHLVTTVIHLRVTCKNVVLNTWFRYSSLNNN